MDQDLSTQLEWIQFGIDAICAMTHEYQLTVLGDLAELMRQKAALEAMLP
jgi:hypothetical protein